jgi:hypothetical protein
MGFIQLKSSSNVDILINTEHIISVINAEDSGTIINVIGGASFTITDRSYEVVKNGIINIH